MKFRLCYVSEFVFGIIRKILDFVVQVSKLCLHDLMESMACGIVSDTAYPSGLELLAASSLFLGAFLGAIILVFRMNFGRREKCVSLLNAIHF
jgi:hypothetical protein